MILNSIPQSPVLPNLFNLGNLKKSIKILCTEKDLTLGWLYSEFIRKLRDLKEFDLKKFCYFRTTSGKFDIDYILTEYNRPLFDIPHNTILIPVFRQYSNLKLSDKESSFYNLSSQREAETLKTPMIRTEDFEYLRSLGEGGFAHIFLVKIFLPKPKPRPAANIQASFTP